MRGFLDAGLQRGQDEDRRRRPRRGPASHRGRPRGPRRRRLPPRGRRQRPVRPRHRAGVRPGPRPLRAVLVRGGRRPAGLPPQRHARPSTTATPSRPARTCSPSRTPATSSATAACARTATTSRSTPPSATGWSSTAASRTCSPSTAGPRAAASRTAATSSPCTSPPRSSSAATSPTPGEFQPTGGFADDAVVENSQVGTRRPTRHRLRGQGQLLQGPARAARVSVRPTAAVRRTAHGSQPSARQPPPAPAASALAVRPPASGQLWFQVVAGRRPRRRSSASLPRASAPTMAPLNDWFIGLVKMIVVPVIFCVMVTGIASMDNLRKAGRIGVQGHRLLPGPLPAVDADRAGRRQHLPARRRHEHRPVVPGRRRHARGAPPRSTPASPASSPA